MDVDEVIRLITEHPYEFAQGFEEAKSSFGMTFDGSADSDRSTAYDLGRSLRLGLEVEV